LRLERAVLILIGFTGLLQAQYAGPAILSRGEAPVTMSPPSIKFRPYVEFSAVYDTGLAGVFAGSNGGLANSSSYGAAVSWGVSGFHLWQHTKLGMDYHGSLSHFAQQTYYDSMNHSILIGFSHQVVRHFSFSLQQSAGMFSRVFAQAGLDQSVPFDPSGSYIPTTDFFDNRTYYASTQADATFQQTARLSYTFGGTFFLNVRRSAALFGSVGSGAHGDIQYRVRRRSTIGAGYTYQHLGFQRAIGSTDLHGAFLSYSSTLTRRLEFSGFGGIMRSETKFLQSTPVDPFIAALLGVATSPQIVHGIEYVPNLGGRLSRSFSRGIAYVSAGHTVRPGNGLFLTSTATYLFGGYTYTGSRHWSLSAEGEYTDSRSIGNVLGVYRNSGGSLTASRQLFRTTHVVFAYSARQYSSPDFVGYNRIIYEGHVGIAFAPGDIPLRLW
jgi:hypothetical protein